jgi:hypothetical protein
VLFPRGGHARSTLRPVPMNVRRPPNATLRELLECCTGWDLRTAFSDPEIPDLTICLSAFLGLAAPSVCSTSPRRR